MAPPVADVLQDHEFQNRLYDQLVQAYPSWTSLSRMVRLRLNKMLPSLVKEAGMQDVMFELVFEKALPEGWLMDLLDGACRDQPNNEQIHLLASEAGLAGVAPDSATTGLRAVARLAQQEQFRGAILIYRSEFDSARRHMGEVGGLKSMHDWLHELQNLCYAPLLDLKPRFPNDSSLEALRGYLQWLRRKMELLADIVRRVENTSLQFPWVKEQLPEAVRQMQAALDTRAPECLDGAIAQLEDILSLQLADIDYQLRTCARELHLPRIIERLQSVHTTVGAQGAAPQDLEQLSSGICALDAIQKDLDKFVEEHQRWQSIDNRRRAFLQALRRRQEDAVLSWNLLANSLRARVQNPTEAWQSQLADAVNALEIAMQNGDGDRKLSLFSTVDGLIAEQFLGADRRLKELTDQVQDTASAMNLVLVSL